MKITLCYVHIVKFCTTHVYMEDLAGYFGVTGGLLMQKFEFMARQQPIWDIDGKRYLYLYKLPSVMIFDKV